MLGVQSGLRHNSFTAPRVMLTALVVVIGLFTDVPVQAFHPDDGNNTPATATPIVPGVLATGTHPDFF